jgi:hypothetical protein
MSASVVDKKNCDLSAASACIAFREMKGLLIGTSISLLKPCGLPLILLNGPKTVWLIGKHCGCFQDTLYYFPEALIFDSAGYFPGV